jgi:small-conductance mechanosensitive channel
MSKRNQRTPQEIIAETEARLTRLRLREAQASAKSDPTLAPLLKHVDDLNKDIREAKKLLGDGPQSGNARIAKHQAWIEKIQLEMSEAVDALEFAEANRASVQAEVVKATMALLKTSKEISAEG